MRADVDLLNEIMERAVRWRDEADGPFGDSSCPPGRDELMRSAVCVLLAIEARLDEVCTRLVALERDSG